MDPILALAGLGVGIVVGLTGMGGGALMTPILVLVFGIPPVAAVSSDLAASAVMKPFGGLVHARRGTVLWPVVGWLCVGSVPSAFLGVLLLRLIGSDATVQRVIQVALAIDLQRHAARMDLDGEWARRVVRAGAKLTISTDAHAPSQLDHLYLGVASARRGWATRADVLNVLPLEELLEHLACRTKLGFIPFSGKMRYISR